MCVHMAEAECVCIFYPIQLDSQATILIQPRKLEFYWPEFVWPSVCEQEPLKVTGLFMVECCWS